jgi:hypothetical protein
MPPLRLYHLSTGPAFMATAARRDIPSSPLQLTQSPRMPTCEFEVLPGPGKLMRWGVLGPAVHDDMLISAALVSVLDGMEWQWRGR